MLVLFVLSGLLLRLLVLLLLAEPLVMVVVEAIVDYNRFFLLLSLSSVLLL